MPFLVDYTLAMGDNSTISRQSMKTSSAVDLSVKTEYDICHKMQPSSSIPNVTLHTVHPPENPGSIILTIPEAVSTSNAVCTVARGLLDCTWRTITWLTSLCCLVTKWSSSSSMLSNDCSRRDTWLMSDTLPAAAAVGVGAWFLDNSMASRCVLNKLFD